MYKLIQGNALQEIGHLKERGELFDMVLTDPPYSSGGRMAEYERTRPIENLEDDSDE